MKLKSFILIVLVFSLTNFLKAESRFELLPISVGNQLESDVTDFTEMEEAKLVNVFTYSGITIFGFDYSDYEFILEGEKVGGASFWICTYVDVKNPENYFSCTFFSEKGSVEINVLILGYTDDKTFWRYSIFRIKTFNGYSSRFC